MSTVNKKKRLLLIAPVFYDYYKEIEQGIKVRGWEVDTVLVNFANNSYLYRFFFVKKRWTREKYTQKYYIKQFSKLRNEYNVVLVIRGDSLSGELLELLKNRNPNAHFIMYQWDSVENNKNALLIKKWFDEIYTFDMEDAKNQHWIYRPLFFIENKDEHKNSPKYDFVFIGTLYYKRIKLLQKIKKYCCQNGNTLYDYLYSPQLVFFLHKYILFDKDYSNVCMKDVRFRSLSNLKVRETYRNANILVDYAADNQSGLTMRTIESIGYRCKLITNNKNVMKTDIYEYGNVFIYDLDNFYIPADFIKKPYRELPDKLMYYYSLSGWLDDILGSINSEG